MKNTIILLMSFAVALFFGSCKPELQEEEDGIIINGVKWATRNVGAHGQFVANPEDFGGYYQWGRKGDGHEQPTSPNYPINDTHYENGVVSGSENFDTNDQIVNTYPAYGKFIKQSEYPWDWRVPQNDALWNAGSEVSPVKSANDPCPCGWRVPTLIELESLGSVTNEWSNLNGVDGYLFGDGEPKLFLPAAGYRDASNGSLYDTGTFGTYWSNTPDSTNACNLYFSSGGFHTNGSYHRADDFSVRCVSE